MKLIALIFSALLCNGVAFADGASLVSISGVIENTQEASRLSVKERDLLSRLRLSKSTRRAVVITIDKSALLSTVVKIEIPGGPVLRLLKTREDRRADGGATWEGKIDSGGSAIISTYGDELFGSIETPNQRYTIQGLNAKLCILVEIDPTGFPPDHAPVKKGDAQSSKIMPLSRPNFKSEIAPALSTTTPTLHIFIAFTPSAAQYLGGTNAAAITAVDLLNSSFSDSLINLRATLSGTTTLAAEYSTAAAALAAAMTSDTLKKRRNDTDADIVILVASFTDDCGASPPPILAVPASAFSAIRDYCFIGSYSMAHEIGHLLGAAHDPAHADHPSPFSYGYGFQFYDSRLGAANPNNCVRDIMSYPQICAGDRRINKWSNKNLEYIRFSIPNAVAIDYFGNSASDIATVFNETGSSVANFHLTKLPLTTLSIISNIIGSLIIFDGPPSN